MAKGKTVPLSAAMKAVGRNMARANQQASSPKVPANMNPGSSGVKMPSAKSMGTYGGGGMDKAGSGGGKARGTGAASKGTSFRGVF